MYIIVISLDCHWHACKLCCMYCNPGIVLMVLYLISLKINDFNTDFDSKPCLSNFVKVICTDYPFCVL